MRGSGTAHRVDDRVHVASLGQITLGELDHDVLFLEVPARHEVELQSYARPTQHWQIVATGLACHVVLHSGAVAMQRITAREQARRTDGQPPLEVAS